MKGFGGWIEIFHGGEQRDSNGKTHDGNALIDAAVNTFDAAYYEPPAVIGHPKNDDPAYGLVEALRADRGDGGKKVLLAKFKNVQPEFEDMVRSGRFSKRSAAFYPDGRLRHVGFLGAMPPAVKGLKNIRFNDDGTGAVTFTFNENKEARGMHFAEMLDFLKFWESAKGKAEPAKPAGDTDKTFSEADLEAAKTAAAKAAKDQALAEFAEQREKEALATRNAVTAGFIDGLIKDGKIPPSWKDAGLVAFMQELTEAEIEFSEGKKQTPAEWFKSFLTGFGKAPLFSELATKEKAGDSAEFAEAKKDEEAGRKIAAKAGAKFKD